MAPRRAFACTSFALGVGFLGSPSVVAQQQPGSAPDPVPRIDRLLHAPDPKERTPLFYRAQSIEGISEKVIEAWGAVELRDRTHRFTADWARYDLEIDEILAKGNVTVRNLSDSISGPEMKLNRQTETGYVKEARYELGPAPTRPSQFLARGRATELLFARPE